MALTIPISHDKALAERPAANACPRCERRPAESVATLPYVRPDGLGARFGAKTLVGCTVCVRGHLILETLRSSLDGWGSPAAFALNPVLIVYGLARSLIVVRDRPRVARLLRAAGVWDPIDPVQIAYRLAAALIAADNKILPPEIAAASRIGGTLFTDFDEAEFQEVIAARRDLPEPGDLALMLKTAVPSDIRAAVYKYLIAIATSDDDVAPEEHALLVTVARNLGLARAGKGLDHAA